MTITPIGLEFLRDHVAKFLGNQIEPRHAIRLQERLAPLASAEGLQGIEELIEAVRQRPMSELGHRVAESLTVNETQFFRDRSVYETLRKHVLPAIIDRNKDRKQIRIWSAACASGQEPYSIAMYLRVGFPHLADWDIKILATDVSSEMIVRASKGEYSDLEVQRGLPNHERNRFFTRSTRGWQINAEIRDMIEFRRLNLIQPWPKLDQFDLIMMRNVLVYFPSAIKEVILTRAAKALGSDGLLFIGASELLIGMNLPLRRESVNGVACYRHCEETALRRVPESR